MSGRDQGLRVLQEEQQQEQLLFWFWVAYRQEQSLDHGMLSLGVVRAHLCTSNAILLPPDVVFSHN